MTTRISVRDIAGRVVGRCDAHCHHAKSKKCECICGGKFHGKGTDVLAMAVSYEEAEAQLDAFRARNPAHGQLEIRIASEIQLRLFDPDETEEDE